MQHVRVRASARRVLVAAMAATVAASAADPIPPLLRAPNAQPVGGGMSLSLAQAIAMADARSPDVVLASHSVRQAEARRVGAGIIMPANPRLSAEARPPVTGGTLEDVGYGGMLDFLFEVGGAPGARVREAHRHADVAREELRVAKLNARIEVWQSYLRAVVADRRLEGTRAAIAIAERVLSASRQRVEAGAAGEIETTLAQSEVSVLRASLDGTRHQRGLSLMQLRQALDLPAGRPLTLTTHVDVPGVPPALDTLLARALKTRPELAATRKRLGLLDASEERLKKEVFPRLGFYLGVDAAPVSPIFGQVGIAIELPFVQRNQGPRARVRAARDTEMARLALQMRGISRDVVNARRSYELRLAELKRLTDHALPAAERTLALVEAGWRSGHFDIFRVTSAARDVTRIRGLRLDALEAAWLERVRLDRAVGGLER